MADRGGRLLFLAMAAPSGVAGNHYSMRDLARAFTRQGWSVEVILFSPTGTGISPSLAGFNPSFVTTGATYGGAIRTLRTLAGNERADVVVAFDELSSRIAICALFLRLEKLLIVKPGGVSSSRWSAASREFVVFSAEDLLFLRALKKFRNVHVNLITGRVETPRVDHAAVEQIRREVVAEHGAELIAVCPVRIARGKSFFINAVLKSFETERRRSDRTLALLIIGTEQESDFRKELEAKIRNLPISICTNPRYTHQLSAIIPAGDIVYAIGRTAMEALLLGRRVFCPSGRKEPPVWEITPENFYTALSGNFTGRNGARNLYSEIVSDPHDPPRNSGGGGIQVLAHENMSSDAAIRHYLAAFDRLKTQPPTLSTQGLAFCFSRIRLLGIALRNWLRPLVSKTPALCLNKANTKLKTPGKHEQIGL